MFDYLCVEMVCEVFRVMCVGVVRGDVGEEFMDDVVDWM